MKTTDLIPIILEQLVDGDKYGYEIVKQIEDSSNGKLVIKQPTLYSVLKKLEQGKFISSYWKDSEIGGKRHYYKLTDNGRAQLDTYPPLEVLIKDALVNEGYVDSATYTPIASEVDIVDKFAPSPTAEENNDYINDIQIDEAEFNTSSEIEDIEIKPTPIDLTSPTESKSNFDSSEVEFKPIDLNISATSNSSMDEIRLESTNEPNNTTTPLYASIFDAIDYDDNSSQPSTDNIIISSIDSKVNQECYCVEQNLTNSDETPKFTEKVENIEEPYVVNKLYDKLTPNKELITEVESNAPNVDLDTSSPIEPMEEVKYLNYVDFEKDKAVLKHRKTITKHIQKMALTCITLLLLFISTFIICNKYCFSKLYYLTAIVVCLIIILYPIILLTRISKIRLKHCSRPFRYSISRDFFIKLSLFLSLVITIFAYNLTSVHSISDIFKMNNFASFGAPIIFSFATILDFVYSSILYKKYTK